TSTTPKFLISGAVNSQRNPRVAMIDATNEGLAVWIDGTTTIYAAKVVEDQNGVRLGSRFELYRSTQTLVDVDVAAIAPSSGMGNDGNFLVTWRHTGLAGIMARLSSTSSPSAQEFVLSASGVNAGPAVAWDQGQQVFQVAWNQGTEIVTRSVTPAGLIGTQT